jgi:hypothetical protein
MLPHFRLCRTNLIDLYVIGAKKWDSSLIILNSHQNLLHFSEVLWFKLFEEIFLDFRIIYCRKR